MAAVVVLALGCDSPPPSADPSPETDDGTSVGTTDADPPAPTGAATSGIPATSGDPSGTTGDPPDEGSDDGGSSTSGEAEVGIPVFIAQGNIGRTVMSCDDGQTWVADRAWDSEGDPLLCGSTDPVRCWEGTCSYMSGGECVSSNECDCGHHPGFAKGIAFGDGQFVATWGWGYSGSVRRSTDGVQWDETLAEDVTFGGLAYGAGRFVLSNRYPMHSPDGATWTAGDEADFRGPNGEITWSVRRFAFADYDGGRFVATANPPQSVLVSSDGGQTWWPPSDIPDGCLANISTYGGITYGNGATVGVGSEGTTCRSLDGGDTWTLGNIGGGQVLGHLLWTGEQFVTWGPGIRYTSEDGESWTSTPLTPEGTWIGPAAHHEATGTFVAISRVWDGYEDQTMLRSEDGVTWERIEAFAGGHPVFEIAAGYVESSEACPQ